MRFSIMFKSIAVLIGSILIAALGIFFTSRHFMYEGFEHSIHEELTTMRGVVDANFTSLKTRLLQEAELLADGATVKDALTGQKYEALKTTAKMIMGRCAADVVLIVDAAGTVLARGQSDRSGDSALNFPLIQEALQGQAVADVVHLADSSLSVASATPIRVEGRIVIKD